MVTTVGALKNGLELLLRETEVALPVRFSIMGHPDNLDGISLVLAECGLKLRKRLLKLRRMKTCRQNDPSERPSSTCVEYATEVDASEILSMLNIEFDLYGDNLPEIKIIKHNAQAKRIAIIRRDNRIATILYFQLRHKVYTDIYDLCLSKYRGRGLFKEVAKLVESHACQSGPIIKTITWRDPDNPYVMALSAKLGEESENICIQNWMYCSVDKHLDLP